MFLDSLDGSTGDYLGHFEVFWVTRGCHFICDNNLPHDYYTFCGLCSGAFIFGGVVFLVNVVSGLLPYLGPYLCTFFVFCMGIGDVYITQLMDSLWCNSYNGVNLKHLVVFT